jgi:transposase InsO family protein
VNLARFIRPSFFGPDSNSFWKRDLFAYIEGFYNRIRRHSAIGSISPIEMELKAA